MHTCSGEETHLFLACPSEPEGLGLFLPHSSPPLLPVWTSVMRGKHQKGSMQDPQHVKGPFESAILPAARTMEPSAEESCHLTLPMPNG